MKRILQFTLQDRIGAMFRVLQGGVVATTVFSLVFFSPLIDFKSDNSAHAQSRGGGGGSDGGSGGNSSGGGGNSGGGSSGSSGGGSSGGGSSSSGGGGNSGGGDSDQLKNSAASASQKPGSQSLVNDITSNRQSFSGNSEPSGGTLSKQQEREAIQNGWK